MCPSFVMYLVMNSLPNNNILALTKLKAFADDNFSIAQMVQLLFDRERRSKKHSGKRSILGSILGKGENAGCQHFLLFPECFHKTSFLGLLEVGKGLVNLSQS